MYFRIIAVERKDLVYQKYWDLVGWVSHIRVELSLRAYRRALVSVYDGVRDLLGLVHWEEV